MHPVNSLQNNVTSEKSGGKQLSKKIDINNDKLFKKYDRILSKMG